MAGADATISHSQPAPEPRAPADERRHHRPASQRPRGWRRSPLTAAFGGHEAAFGEKSDVGQSETRASDRCSETLPSVHRSLLASPRRGTFLCRYPARTVRDIAVRSSHGSAANCSPFLRLSSPWVCCVARATGTVERRALVAGKQSSEAAVTAPWCGYRRTGAALCARR